MGVARLPWTVREEWRKRGCLGQRGVEDLLGPVCTASSVHLSPSTTLCSIQWQPSGFGCLHISIPEASSGLVPDSPQLQ